jgi:Cys-rich protein (TIGR01571 family)
MNICTDQKYNNIDTEDIHSQNAIQQTWSTGLYDCDKDYNGTFEICFCHMCQLSRQYNVIKHNKSEINIEMCVFILFMDIFFPPLGTLLTAFKIRNSLQERYNLDRTDFAGDIASIIFCLPCVMCQNYREMSVRNEWPNGFIASYPFKLRKMC